MKRPIDKYAELKAAEQAAKKLIIDGGYGDLVQPPRRVGGAPVPRFYVMAYEDEELREMGDDLEDWIGMYVTGSLEHAPQGLTILINVDQHKDRNQMLGTLLHEVGHALWELISIRGRKKWHKAAKEDAWGAEEAFADDFMNLCLGRTYDMNHEQLFREITALA